MIEQELIEQKLFELLDNYSFDELSVEEKAFVLRQMKEADYKVQRDSIVLIAELELQETLETVVIKNVSQTLDKEPHWLLVFIGNIFSIKIPAVAFLLPIIILAGVLMFNNDSVNSSGGTGIAATNNDLDHVIDAISIDTLKSIVEDTILSIEPKRLAQRMPESAIVSSMSNSQETLIADMPVEKNTTGTTVGLSMRDNSYSKYAMTIYNY